MSDDHKVSRRRFLGGLAAAPLVLLPRVGRADAGYNVGAFWRKSAGGLTSNGYVIPASLRFNSAASALLSRTPSAAGNRQTWTLSFWVKRTRVGVASFMFTANAVAGQWGPYLMFTAADQIYFGNDSSSSGAGLYCTNTTSQAFRDTSSWYHLVWRTDTTQSTAANRFRLYVNGAQVTAFAGTGFPNQNDNLDVGNTVLHRFGAARAGEFSDLYLSEIYLIDGQSLDAAAFGQLDTNSGQWIPRRYTGGFGTNGCYLPLKSASAVSGSGTATGSYPNVAGVSGLGADFSGNNNHWAGAGLGTSDQVIDTPTNDFCTLNTLDKDSGTSVLNGGLTFLSTVNRNAPVRATFALPAAGRWYWEARYDSGATDTGVGITAFNGDLNATNALWSSADTYEYYRGGGYKRNAGANSAYGVAASNGDTLGIAFDAGAGALWFSLNGTWMNGASSAELSAGTTAHAAFSGLSAAKTWLPFVEAANGPQWTVNFGQGGQAGLTFDAASGGIFRATPPAGFKALCAVNLPAPAQVNPARAFDIRLYSGNDSALAVGGLAFAPDLVWLKPRNVVENHYLFDTSRGATRQILTNLTNAESIDPTALSAFGANGFTVGNGSGGSLDNSARNYAAWCWKKGSVPGFDVQTYTGDGTSNRALPHALGAAPAFIVVKDRDNGFNWDIYHQALGVGATLIFTSASTRNASAFGTSAPTASVFFVQDNYSNGLTGHRVVAYLWAPVAGFSRFGSYVGNASADGPFVWCGFKPRFVLIKRADSSGNWCLIDAARQYNGQPTNMYLFPNTTAAELGNEPIDLVSNGFKLRYGAAGDTNTAGGTFVYAAFAESPLAHANAR
jgi:hypothetical protein